MLLVSLDKNQEFLSEKYTRILTVTILTELLQAYFWSRYNRKNLSFQHCIFDPYMWYMPIKHIKDLIFKITFP